MDRRTFLRSLASAATAVAAAKLLPVAPPEQELDLSPISSDVVTLSVDGATVMRRRIEPVELGGGMVNSGLFRIVDEYRYVGAQQ